MTADSRSVSPGANCIPAAGSWQVDEPPQPRTETTSGMVLVRPGQLEVAPEASGGVNARTDENVDDHFAKATLGVGMQSLWATRPAPGACAAVVLLPCIVGSGSAQCARCP